MQDAGVDWKVFEDTNSRWKNLAFACVKHIREQREKHQGCLLLGQDSLDVSSPSVACKFRAAGKHTGNAAYRYVRPRHR